MYSSLKKISAVHGGDYYIDGDIVFTKINGTIYVSADVANKEGFTIGETVTIGYVPEGFYPSINIYTRLTVYSFDRGVIFITPDGSINLIATEKIEANSLIRFSCSYAQ